MISTRFLCLGLLLIAALARPAAAQTWQWAAQTSGPVVSANNGTREVWATTVDDAGNTYVTGRYSGPAQFGTVALNVSNNNWAVFVAKLSVAGQWQWAVSVNGGMYSEGGAIAVDPAGTAVYVGGTLSTGSYALGPGPVAVIPSSCSHGGFVAKLSASTGQWQWAQAATDGSGVYALALGPGGALYAGGYCRGTNFRLGSAVVPTGTPVLPFGSFFVTRLAAATGQGQWLTPVALASGQGGRTRGLAVDGTGNVLVTGVFDGSPRFGTTTLTGRGGFDTFLAKISPTGAWTWATSLGSPGAEYVMQVCADAAGNAYVAGSANGAITAGPSVLPAVGNVYALVAKCSPAGQWLWASRPGGANHQAAGLTFDGGGRLYASGALGTTAATFGTTTLTPTPATMTFLSQLDPGTGQWQQAQLLPSGGNWYGYGLCATATGTVYVAGQFTGSIACGPAITLTTATGVLDSYFGKLTWASTATALLPVSGPVGTSVLLTGTRLEGVSRVQVGGREAVFVRVSPTQLRLTVPVGLPAGPQALLLATPHGPLAGPGFAVTATALSALPGAVGVTLAAYPNPATDAVTVTADLPTAGPVAIELFDVLGCPVRRQMLTAPVGPLRQTVNLRGLAAGAYVLRLTPPTGPATSRRVVRE